MKIDKSQILELIKSQAGADRASQADSELPDTVDTDAHAGLLEKYGLNVADLAKLLPGGLGDKLGGLL